MSGASVRLPEGIALSYANGRSLDAQSRVQVDGNDKLEGGIEPDVRVPITVETVRAQWLEVQDVALNMAVDVLTQTSSGGCHR